MAQPLTTRVISTLQFSRERTKDSKFHVLYLSEYQGRQLTLLGLQSQCRGQPVTVPRDVKPHYAQHFTASRGCMVLLWHAGQSFGAQEAVHVHLSPAFHRDPKLSLAYKALPVLPIWIGVRTMKSLQLTIYRANIFTKKQFIHGLSNLCYSLMIFESQDVCLRLHHYHLVRLNHLLNCLQPPIFPLPPAVHQTSLPKPPEPRKHSPYPKEQRLLLPSEGFQLPQLTVHSPPAHCPLTFPNSY